MAICFCCWFPVRRKPRRRFTTCVLICTLDLDVRLIRRHLKSLKVFCSVMNASLLVFSFSRVMCLAFPFFHGTGLPGVLAALPDSYSDPEHKDYGGENFVFFWFYTWIVFPVLMAANVDIFFCNWCVFLALKPPSLMMKWQFYLIWAYYINYRTTVLLLLNLLCCWIFVLRFCGSWLLKLLFSYNNSNLFGTAELFVNGEIVQRSPERQRKIASIYKYAYFYKEWITKQDLNPLRLVRICVNKK